VFFKDLSGHAIDHIDLWDGSRTKTGWYDSATELWFWELK